MVKSKLSRGVSTSSASYNPTAHLPTATSPTEFSPMALNKIQETLVESDRLLTQVGEVEERGRHMVSNLSSSKVEKLDVGDLVEMDRALQAIYWVETIKTVGKQLDDIWSTTVSVNPTKKKLKEDESKVVDLHRVLVAVVESLLNSTCSNLRSYGVKMLECHRERWISRLEKQLEEDLEALNFPQCIIDLDQNENVEDGKSQKGSRDFLAGRSTAEDMIRVNQLQERYRILCDLRLPIDVAEALSGLRVSDPLSIILRPLKKRFKFHFSGNKKTNNPEKPEWYLQQVGAWMRNSQKFFDVCIHPSRRHSETSSDSDFPGHAQFCCGLLNLVIKKLRADIADVIYDDVTLSHLIDEIILFSRDVLSRDFALFIPLDCLPLVVLCDSVVFARWISLERKFAFEKVDDLLLEEGSWHSSIARSDVSKCTLTFEALLQSITNRYKSLTSVKLQLNFVDLQIELLEDLRLRLAQILRQEQAFPLSEKFCLILSSSQYIVDMLSHWAEIPVFLQLQHERCKETQTTEHRGLFQDIAGGFDFLVSDLIITLSDHVFYEVKSRSKPYRCDVKWFSYTINDDTTWDTTPESFPMFQILAAHLTYLSKLLGGTLLLSRIVSQVCDRLCHFFITEVVLENVFSVDGCRQIQVDVERGINAIFEPFLSSGKKPDNYVQLGEVCVLLTLKQANAILLLQSLKDKTEKEGKTILEEFNLNLLSAEQGAKILNRRIELQ